MKKTVPAKITRPGFSGVVPRERLFELLDRSLEKPVTWLSSPAGAGKTKLVTSYLDSRKFPCIWYQCDEGDSDPATFFYYMGLAAKKAAPRHKETLPLLTPEYRTATSTFTRRYFEELFSRLHARHRRFFIVLDNYQDVPAGSPFHEAIAGGLDSVPESVRVVVVSRSDPPPLFARLSANDKITLLGYGDIRFTLDESTSLLRGRVPDLSESAAESMHEKTEGWAAGIILMLERARLKGAEAGPDDFTYGRVFDYFAGEIFDRTEEGVRDFLLRTAFLPILDVPLAENLTGTANAARILSTLSRHNYFTERLSGGGQGYRYHPLFRDFLLSKARAWFGSHKVAALQREAGLLLEQSAQLEDAARLYSEAGEGLLLARMVIHHARELLAQGRNKTVDEWIAGIPAGQTEDNPWLLYWTGMCSFPFDMARTRKYLEKAFSSFKIRDNTTGIFLSWAGIVDTYVFELDEWKHLDACITEFEELRHAYPSFPSKDVDLVASSRMLISLVLRKTDQPKWVHRWFDRVSALLEENPSVDITIDTLFFMSLYYLWKGEYHKNAILLEKAEAGILLKAPSPFAAIRIKMMKGIHFWVTAQYDAALTTLSEALDASEKSGVHVFSSLLWGFRAAAEMASGKMNAARESLRRQMTASLESGRTLGIFFYHLNSAWYGSLDKNLPLAAENLDAIASRVSRMGTPYYRGLWNIAMAQTAFLQDRPGDAKALIRTAHRISRNMKSQVLEWYSLLVNAYFALREGDEKKGFPLLRRALAMARRHGYVHLEFYQPGTMQFLCAKALETGMELAYVKELIGRLGLAPPPRPGLDGPDEFSLESWPYPVEIHTLGRFEVKSNGNRIAVAGKTQKKPLEMIKAIIAFGGVNVPADRVTDALWPEADGDLAQKSFEMTLSRLRRLLGDESLIKYRAGQLSLDLNRCLVDSLALERLIGEIRTSSDGKLVRLCEKAISLYRGSFLSSDTNLPWSAHRREMLKNGLLRAIITAGRELEQRRQWQSAADYYGKGAQHR